MAEREPVLSSFGCTDIDAVALFNHGRLYKWKDEEQASIMKLSSARMTSSKIDFLTYLYTTGARSLLHQPLVNF